MHLVLTYFDQIIGPNVLLSYPNEKLEENVITKLVKFFDLDIEETFFEIILITKKKKIINFNFELDSQWARGNKEFVMLSLIMKREYQSEQFYAFIVDASYKILKTENVYKALYKYDDFHDNDIEIDLTYEQIKNILFDCLNSLIKRLEDKFNETDKKISFNFP